MQYTLCDDVVQGGWIMNEDFLAAAPGFRGRVAAGGRLLAYLFVAGIGALLATAVAKSMFGGTLIDLAQRGVALGVVRALLLLLALVIVPSVVVLRLFREPARSTGWDASGALRKISIGLIAGFGLMVAIAGALWAMGAVRFDFGASGPTAESGGLLLSALLWLALAAGEEGLDRGYAFVQLCRALSFWPAALLSSGWFLFGHIGNAGETLSGVLIAGLVGLLLCYSLRKTGSLWFALGFHAAWNFTQSAIFGFNNSGGGAPVSVFQPHLSGSAWLTGGWVGPEGSLLAFPALLALWWIIRRAR